MINLETVDIHSEEFSRAVTESGTRARLETLAAGVPVFYLDPNTGLDVMEQPDGRMFEIKFVTDRSRKENYDIVRELAAHAA